MKTHHILIVEDEAITRTKLAGYFESEGYRVTTTERNLVTDCLR